LAKAETDGTLPDMVNAKSISSADVWVQQRNASQKDERKDPSFSVGNLVFFPHVEESPPAPSTPTSTPNISKDLIELL